MTKTQNTLLDALIESASKGTATEEVFLERLGTSLTVRGLNTAEFNAATVGITKQTDFMASLVCAATVDSPFSNAALLEKSGAMSPEECASKVLLAGELVEIATVASRLAGFKDVSEVAQ